MTLIHGAGVVAPSASTTTYSRPSRSKPPRPLKNSSAAGAWDERAMAVARPNGGGGAGGAHAGSGIRASWSAIEPRRAISATRATDCSNARASAVIRSARSAYTAPWANSSPRRGRDWLLRTAVSMATCRSCTYDEACSFTMTRSTPSRFMRQYSCARSNWRTWAISSISSIRNRTIGRSPEIACGHSPDWRPAPRAIAPDGALRRRSAYRMAAASRWKSAASFDLMSR
ncbi:hypothetical protein D3C87_1404690 [compost metagenome]